jgi:hypothetical protein
VDSEALPLPGPTSFTVAVAVGEGVGISISTGITKAWMQPPSTRSDAADAVAMLTTTSTNAVSTANRRNTS